MTAEIKKKVLATPEQDCTLTKVLSFVEAEESGKYSLSESKLFDSVAGISTFKRQQRDNGKVEDPPQQPQAPPSLWEGARAWQLHDQVQKVWYYGTQG